MKSLSAGGIWSKAWAIAVNVTRQERAFGFGGMDTSRWLAGGPAPEGEGKIPNITPHEKALGGWSEDEIANYLETGFTPDFDSVGGSMVSVQENMARLPPIDIAAIAAYLKSIPPVAPAD